LFITILDGNDFRPRVELSRPPFFGPETVWDPNRLRLCCAASDSLTSRHFYGSILPFGLLLHAHASALQGVFFSGYHTPNFQFALWLPEAVFHSAPFPHPPFMDLVCFSAFEVFCAPLTAVPCATPCKNTLAMLKSCSGESPE